jgi:hypothetical protein
MRNGNGCRKKEGNEILRETFPKHIMINQKQLENVEYSYFSYLGVMITNGARCTRELKSRIFLAKAALNKKTSPANWILECSFVWC